MRRDTVCKIISNKQAGKFFFEMKAEWISAAKICAPGQFFMINIPGVFLRRPMGVHKIEKKTISFLYKVAGKGTGILSQMKKGKIEILGPLGNGYDLNIGSKTPVLIAGGTGIASLYCLAAAIKKKKGILFYGARSRKDLICLDKFRKLGWRVFISTEDGSKGYKGFVTEMFEKDLALRFREKENFSSYYIYVCGPSPMMNAAIKIARHYSLSGCVSLEEKMACGVGNCQGCSVLIDGQNKMVCKDGPVFYINQNL
ncbi:MAG: dihydroorotate dehydrogenase electron transfer subunit [Elusimicrobiota bacterium]|jgi:dihydroorotate dehydrogenase electron transfer subunit|nr:dihydroorotate dehydrogenase electron transfer subunit [Elusimicrobiota bacterium]